MIRLTPSLVKNPSAMVSAGPKTNRGVKASLCSEWTWKSKWICIVLDHIPNKLTDVHNWNTWKHPSLHWIGCRFSSPPEALGIAPATLPWLCGLRQQPENGHFLKEGGKKSSRKQCSLCEAEAQESRESEMPFVKYLPGQDAHLSIAMNPVWRNGVCAHAIKP